MNSTICAISTAPGVGGIAVVRISGGEAFAIADKVFRPASKNNTVATMAANSVHFGQIVYADGSLLDEVLLTKFRAPHSFTGEDVVEIACHGSIFVQQELVKLLIQSGCTMARPGEFTRRAFANGKMDLSQAEAVADLIAAQSRAAHNLALRQMRGVFSDELARLRERLLTFTSLLELELDFSDHEELEFADRTQLRDLCNEIERKIRRLTDSFSTGNAIKNGIPVAIVGETNAGKSTLLNALVGDERAIVSDIHGTTRDAIEDTVTLRGVLFRFIDTAGLRPTTDTIENVGIERSLRAISNARIVLWLIDYSQGKQNLQWLAQQIEQRCEGKQLLIILNKIDLFDEAKLAELRQKFADIGKNVLCISAKERIHLDALQTALYEAAQLPETAAGDVIVANVRHYEALQKAHEAIERVQSGLESGLSGDLLAQDLRECLGFLGEITGQITSDEVLGNIFKHFCIGK